MISSIEIFIQSGQYIRINLGANNPVVCCLLLSARRDGTSIAAHDCLLSLSLNFPVCLTICRETLAQTVWWRRLLLSTRRNSSSYWLYLVPTLELSLVLDIKSTALGLKKYCHFHFACLSGRCCSSGLRNVLTNKPARP